MTIVTVNPYVSVRKRAEGYTKALWREYWKVIDSYLVTLQDDHDFFMTKNDEVAGKWINVPRYSSKHIA